MGYGKAVQDELREPARRLRDAIPAVYEGFGQLHAAALEAGALDAMTKELIALAIAVGQECDGCIASHARGAARAGASQEEVAEAIGVAILMKRWPGDGLRTACVRGVPGVPRPAGRPAEPGGPGARALSAG